MGMMPMLIPAFSKMLNARRVKIPAHNRRPKESRRDLGRPEHPPGDQAEQGEDRCGTDESELFPHG